MKANEMPKKIYLFDNPILDFTKLSVRQGSDDIEYIRADAFIEKAEDLEKAAVEAFKQIVDDERNSFLEIFKAGAEWQKQKDSIPVSEDLEKAAEQDVCEVVNCCSATRIPNDHIPSWVQDAMVNEFIHGAKWKKEQIMKDATEVTVHIDAGGYPYILQLELYDYDKDVPLAKEGDKYKVVLIKED